jgi:hypothetical protein
MFKSTIRTIVQGILGIAALALLGAAFLLFLRVEHNALYRHERPIRPGIKIGPQVSQRGSQTQSDSLHELLGSKSTEDDRRMTAVFSSDTLPRMLKIGLIKELRRGESNSLMIVNGRMWRARKKETKQELLLQLRSFNKVHNHPTPVQVRDDSTRQLLAEISPTAEVSIFL